MTEPDPTTQEDATGSGIDARPADRYAGKDRIDATPPEDSADLTFGEAIGRLEHIASQLERADLDLDEALKQYEEGLALAKACLERLEHAELRIQKLAASSVPAGEEP